MISAWYAHVYTQIERIAWRYGYALALHGSMGRDLDVIAVPWTDDADTQERLLKAIEKAVLPEEWRKPQKGVKRRGLVPTLKPQGRKAYSIIFDSYGHYIDISIMPRKSEWKK